jgi:glycosyltransferase involved in cell wall biosynthesis
MKSILLITHDTSLSGAPKSILLIFEDLVKKGYKLTTIALRGGGYFEERFKNISENYYNLDLFSKKVDFTFKKRFQKKIFGTPILSSYESILKSISKNKFDFIYSNTIVSLELGIKMKALIKTKLIVHIHELKTVIDEYCPNLSQLEQLVDLFIVPSILNQQCLTNWYFISENKVKMIREATEVDWFRKVDNSNGNSVNVLMCGGAYWRKGDDLFILIANSILKRNPNFNFYWVGYQSEERKRVNLSDLSKLGISDSVFFIEESVNPIEWYYKADIFLLSSREDPFPLAAIEAGMLGIPIFCFEQATGISEVINKYCVVPYLNVEEMAFRIDNLLNDQTLKDQIKLENKTHFQKFTTENISSELNLILTELL